MNASATLRRGLVAAAFITFFVHAISPGSGVLHLDGILVLRGDHDRTAHVVLIPLDGPETVMEDVTGHFVLDLGLDRIYLLSFERTGMVTKQIYFNTAVPEEARTRELEFPFMVTLYPEGKNGTYAYAGPVGVVYFKPELDDFGFDTDYTLKPGTEMAANFAALTDRNVVPTPAFVRAPRTKPEHSGWNEVRQDPLGDHAENTRSEAPLVHRIQYYRPADLATIARVDHATLSTTTAPVASVASKIGPPIPIVRDDLSPTSTLSRPSFRRTDHMEDIPMGREEELIVERLRVITVVRLTERTGHVTEYRRVADRNGDIFYFQDGLNIPASIYHERVGR